MNAAALESQPVGDILLHIVQEWSKVGGKVTVSQFCEVSKNHLKIGRVEHTLQEAGNTSIFSKQFSFSRPGDSKEELV